LIRKFRAGFKANEQGQNRNWKEIEQAKIEDLYKVNK
jgi:hypothetical protein